MGFVMYLTIGICLLLSALIILFGLWGQRKFFASKPTEIDLEAAKADYQKALNDLNQNPLEAEDRALAEAQLSRDLIRLSETAQTTPLLETKSVALVWAIGAVIAAILYVGNGPHLYQDYPYKAQLATWTQEARDNPDSLPPVALAAVFEQDKKAEAKNPTYWLAVGTLHMYAGQYYNATKSFQMAQALQGKDFANWSDLGEALTFLSKGATTKGAVDAFDAALKLDTNDARAHYYLGKFALNDGQYETAKGHFLAARAALAPNDHRIKLIDELLGSVAQAEKGQMEAQNRINAMVSGLESRLKDNPDDPDGWARLIRSYQILGQPQKAEKAIAMMRAHYKDRPAQIAAILEAAEKAVGSENTERTP